MRNVLIILAITAGLYYVVDVAFGAFFEGATPTSERLHAPANAHEPYATRAFHAERVRQPDGWITPVGTRLVLPGEFHGEFFDIDVLPPTGNTYRRTVNRYSREEADVLVLLLGGSTMYNSEVPNEFTVASQLAARLNREGGERYHVVNAGVTSVNTAQERERLADELAKGLRPDIVISLSGVNDVFQGVYNNSPDGVMFSAAGRSSLSARIKALLPLNIYRYLRRTMSQRQVPPHLVSATPESLSGLVDRTARVYRDNMKAMDAMSRQVGAEFLALLQPHLFSAEYDSRRADIPFARQVADTQLPKVDVAYRAGYPALARVAGELAGEGVRVFDGRALFAGSTDPMFLDYCHVNRLGNHLLSEEIALHIEAARHRDATPEENGSLP